MQHTHTKSGWWAFSLKFTPFIIVLIFILGCQSAAEKNLWFIDCDKGDFDQCGYKDAAGNIKINYGKYPLCFTDTFKTYAIVLRPDIGYIGINKKEEILYKVLPYDNGPDYVEDGYFRIIENLKIGFVDAATGLVKIPPTYTAAMPFHNKYAPVCPDCIIQKDGEYNLWVGGKWGLIDKKGKIVVEPEFDSIVEIGADNRVKVREGIYEKWIDIK